MDFEIISKLTDIETVPSAQAFVTALVSAKYTAKDAGAN